jgi:hypothetical protein
LGHPAPPFDPCATSGGRAAIDWGRAQAILKSSPSSTLRSVLSSLIFVSQIAVKLSR